MKPIHVIKVGYKVMNKYAKLAGILLTCFSEILASAGGRILPSHSVANLN